MQEIKTQLKKFRLIEPGEAFRKRALNSMIEEKPEARWAFNWRSLWAPALASLALILVIGGRLISARPSLASFNPEGLRNEFNGLNINIELKEISYRQSVNQEIASAITEIADNKTRHLSPSLLEEEASDVDWSEEGNSEIDDLLNQVIF